MMVLVLIESNEDSTNITWLRSTLFASIVISALSISLHATRATIGSSKIKDESTKIEIVVSHNIASVTVTLYCP